MDNRITEVFETRRGKKCVIIDRFKFGEFRKIKAVKCFVVLIVSIT
jgi:hypothetical protein